MNPLVAAHVTTVPPRLATYIEAANVVDVSVAGVQGYSGQLSNNSIVTVWDAGNGWWGQLYIDAAQARGADGIIESVQAVAMAGA